MRVNLIFALCKAGESAENKLWCMPLPGVSGIYWKILLRDNNNNAGIDLRNKINKRKALYFFKYKPEMIHCFVFKTNFVRAYFEYFHKVAKLFIIKIFGQERGI